MVQALLTETQSETDEIAPFYGTMRLSSAKVARLYGFQSYKQHWMYNTEEIGDKRAWQVAGNSSASSFV